MSRGVASPRRRYPDQVPRVYSQPINKSAPLAITKIVCGLMRWSRRRNRRGPITIRKPGSTCEANTSGIRVFSSVFVKRGIDDGAS